MFIILFLLFSFAFIPNTVLCKTPDELIDLVKKDLDLSRNILMHRGYNVVNFSFFKEIQYWWNENSKTCVSVLVEDGKIAEFSTITSKKCEQSIATLPKVGSNHFAGSAPVRNERLDSERVKLSEQGLRPVYWIKSQILDRSIEYWVSGNGEICKHLVFETISGGFVTAGNDEIRQCLFIGRATKM